jgi:hypothetical protein
MLTVWLLLFDGIPSDFLQPEIKRRKVKVIMTPVNNRVNSKTLLTVKTMRSLELMRLSRVQGTADSLDSPPDARSDKDSNRDVWQITCLSLNFESLR